MGRPNKSCVRLETSAVIQGENTTVPSIGGRAVEVERVLRLWTPLEDGTGRVCYVIGSGVWGKDCQRMSSKFVN